MEKKRVFWSIAFYLWCITILFLTSMPFTSGTRQPVDGGFRFDYLEHFILFFAVPALYYLSSGAWINRIIRDPYYVFLIGILFSLLTEIQQYKIPGRSFNYIDLLLNLGGYLAGVFIFFILLRKKSSNPEENPEDLR